jgi:23S rRNA G2069 N7-methylase RlmK/C1962 C5-methylase RlmI
LKQDEEEEERRTVKEEGEKKEETNAINKQIKISSNYVINHVYSFFSSQREVIAFYGCRCFN